MTAAREPLVTLKQSLHQPDVLVMVSESTKKSFRAVVSPERTLKQLEREEGGKVGLVRAEVAAWSARSAIEAAAGSQETGRMLVDVLKPQGGV